MFYQEKDSVNEDQLYEDWLDPDNSMKDLEEEYEVHRQKIRDTVSNIHEPDIGEGILED